jgi:hypothetical protein
MRTWHRGVAWALASAGIVAACSSENTYDETFTCTTAGTAGCPASQPCPTVPLGSGGCEDLPGLFEHPPTKVDVGRPEGCRVGLSYGNPYYGDSQQTCTCSKVQPTSKPTWVCPI